jgi:hypothetical protein
MKIKLACIFFGVIYYSIGICDDSLSYIWKSSYYGSIPNKKDVDPAYCKQH